MGRVGNSRRFFLHLLLGSGLCQLVIGPAKRASIFPAKPDDDLIAGLTSTLADKESARVIGMAYLRSVPEESSAETLVNAICSRSSPSDGLFLMGQPERLRDVLVEQIRGDFAHGRVSVLEGWILSVTEARLCALVALT